MWVGRGAGLPPGIGAPACGWLGPAALPAPAGPPRAGAHASGWATFSAAGAWPRARGPHGLPPRDLCWSDSEVASRRAGRRPPPLLPAAPPAPPPPPPESIKRGICSASRLPQSGHYAFLSPPLGATYCLLGTWGPEAEPRSGHRLGPGWLFPRGRPVPGGEGESRRQAGWTLGPMSRGRRHEPPRARRRQTAGVCSLTVRSPLPLPGPRSLWSWGSRMSFPSLRDSGHWVWHPP